MEDRVTAQIVGHSQGLSEKQDDIDPSVCTGIFRGVDLYGIPKETMQGWINFSSAPLFMTMAIRLIPAKVLSGFFEEQFLL